MKISIITPTYNAAEYIHETLDCMLAQTFTDWEAILIDDCSTDNSVEIVKEYLKKDSRFKLIQSRSNAGGPATPRNMGLKHASGDYVAFLDSDDFWLPTKLEKQLQFMEKNNAKLSSTSYILMDEGGNDLKKIVHAQPKMSFNKYLRNTSIGFSSSIISHDILKGIEFRNFPIAEDFAFWLDVFRKGDIMIGLDEVLMKYRVQKNSLSSNKFKSAHQIWRIYRDIEKISFLKSSYYFSCYAINALKKRL